MAAWGEPKVLVKARVKRKRPTPHLRNLAADLQLMARNAARETQKGA